jgi:RNA polymerase sigma-70 factor (ECF subfamily)
MISSLTKEQNLTSALNQVKNEGFEDIITKHIDGLWRVAMHFCKYNKSDAEDLLQDTMLKAFRHKETFIEVTNHYGWLRKILLNTHINRLRDNKKWERQVDITLAQEIHSIDALPIPMAVIGIVKREIWDDEIKKALDELPESYRTVFLLSDIEGFSRDEIADMTGLPKGTIASHVYRARRKLAKELERYALDAGYIKKETLESEQAEMIANSMSMNMSKGSSMEMGGKEMGEQ